jgi:Zn-dependent peptidase ImmA (M78 family)/DNA-binding XRE family transcriptional regulator
MFNPTRLVLARRRRGMNLTRLANLTGVSTKSISNYERGDQQPSEETLAGISTALDFPPEFFFGPDVEVVAKEAASFRSLASMTASQRDRALGAGTLAVLLDEWIDKRFDRPTADLPIVETTDPEEAAEIVRAEWRLGTRPIANVIHLLELHGIRAFSLDEQSRNVDAFSFWRDGRPYVMLNTAKSAEHSRFDAAHELGHLVLHRADQRGRDTEHEANKFASAFLMPRAAMLASGLQHASLPTLVKRKSEWKVSVVALIYRLHAVGVLTDWQYRSLYITASKKGYRSAEPRPIPHERSAVLDKVLNHLRTQGVSRRDIAAELQIDVDDFDRLVFDLVMLAKNGGGRNMSPTASGRPHLRLVD